MTRRYKHEKTKKRRTKKFNNRTKKSNKTKKLNNRTKKSNKTKKASYKGGSGIRAKWVGIPNPKEPTGFGWLNNKQFKPCSN